MNPRYGQTAARAGHRCEYCHAPEGVFNFPFEVEHIIPPAQGGADEDHNWALACRACNVRKAAYVRHIDPVTRAAVHLYHPRQDRWDEHFRADAGTGPIEGLMAQGRAMVSRLGMNNYCGAPRYHLRNHRQRPSRGRSGARCALSGSSPTMHGRALRRCRPDIVM